MRCLWRAAFSCTGRGPVPVIRELHARFGCVCMFAVQSVEMDEQVHGTNIDAGH